MKSTRYDWGTIAFLVGYHAALLIGLPIYFLHHTPSVGICVVTGVLVYVSGMSVTAGYHRLYSHLAYKTNPVVEAVLLVFATIATQGSALKWTSDHRKHHAYVDTDRDPYSIKKGFWYAHFIWLFHKAEPIDMKVVADLSRNRLVMLQHRFYVPLMFFTNALTFLIMGYIFNDYLSSFVFIWGVRMFILHHFTWFINSLAHTWGSKTFSQEHSAVDNYFMSVFTFGEGYHNYHHTFASDYRNGIKWYHFDPTKWLIWTLSKCKLAHSLRKVGHERIQEKMIMERKNELIENVKKYISVNRSIFEEKIELFTKETLQKCSNFNQLMQQYQACQKEREPDQDVLKQLQLQIKGMQKNLQADWTAWKKFSKEVLMQVRNESGNLPKSAN